MLFGNLAGSQAWSATIKTNARIDFKVGAHVKLQDGKMYEINSVDTDMKADENRAFMDISDNSGIFALNFAFAKVCFAGITVDALNISSYGNIL